MVSKVSHKLMDRNSTLAAAAEFCESWSLPQEAEVELREFIIEVFDAARAASKEGAELTVENCLKELQEARERIVMLNALMIARGNGPLDTGDNEIKWRVALRMFQKTHDDLVALRQRIEDTVIVAQTDVDPEGGITAYHFKTGAIHRLLAEARKGDGPVTADSEVVWADTRKRARKIVEAVWRHVRRYNDGDIWMDTLKAEAAVWRLLNNAAALSSTGEPMSHAGSYKQEANMLHNYDPINVQDPTKRELPTDDEDDLTPSTTPTPDLQQRARAAAEEIEPELELHPPLSKQRRAKIAAIIERHFTATEVEQGEK